MASRSLAVVLKAVSKVTESLTADGCEKNNAETNDADTMGDGSVPNGMTTLTDGKAIFDDFVWANKDCYWDPHLKESIENLRYIGCLHPSTLLVGGRDIYVETVKSAWTRRVLRPPVGFTLQRVGEMCELAMRAVVQSRFTPLPEAMCVTVAELSRARPPQPVTMASIVEGMQRRHSDLATPPECIVYATLDSLVREGKLYRSGESYGIVTPETYALQSKQRGTSTDNAASRDTRSISCQTDVPSKSFKRSRSLREAWRGDKNCSFSRSESLRYKDGLGRCAAKDINLKTSNAHKDKDKGEKSLLRKLFSRSSKKQNKHTVAPPVEHATFSAQFPPPDCLPVAPSGDEYQQQNLPLRRSASFSSSLDLVDLGPCGLQRHLLGEVKENVYQSIDTSAVSVRPRSRSFHQHRKHANCTDTPGRPSVVSLNNAKQTNMTKPVTSTPLATVKHHDTRLHDSGFYSPRSNLQATPQVGSNTTSRSSSRQTVLASNVAVERERGADQGESAHDFRAVNVQRNGQVSTQMNEHPQCSNAGQENAERNGHSQRRPDSAVQKDSLHLINKAQKNRDTMGCSQHESGGAHRTRRLQKELINETAERNAGVHSGPHQASEIGQKSNKIVHDDDDVRYGHRSGNSRRSRQPNKTCSINTVTEGKRSNHTNQEEDDGEHSALHGTKTGKVQLYACREGHGSVSLHHNNRHSFPKAHDADKTRHLKSHKSAAAQSPLLIKQKTTAAMPIAWNGAVKGFSKEQGKRTGHLQDYKVVGIV